MSHLYRKASICSQWRRYARKKMARLQGSVEIEKNSKSSFGDFQRKNGPQVKNVAAK